MSTWEILCGCCISNFRMRIGWGYDTVAVLWGWLSSRNFQVFGEFLYSKFHEFFEISRVILKCLFYWDSTVESWKKVLFIKLIKSFRFYNATVRKVFFLKNFWKFKVPLYWKFLKITKISLYSQNNVKISQHYRDYTVKPW